MGVSTCRRFNRRKHDQATHDGKPLQDASAALKQLALGLCTIRPSSLYNDKVHTQPQAPQGEKEPPFALPTNRSISSRQPTKPTPSPSLLIQSHMAPSLPRITKPSTGGEQSPPSPRLSYRHHRLHQFSLLYFYRRV